MSFIDDIRRRYAEMDDVQRQNMWFAIIGFVLLILLVMSLSSTADTLGGLLGGGAKYVNKTVGDAQNLRPTR
jgi:hypothetical protein